MNNNDSSGTNTILIVIVLLVIVGFGAWWMSGNRGTKEPALPERNDAGLNVKIEGAMPGPAAPAAPVAPAAPKQ